MSLAIVCPTRGRPNRCARMVQSALETTDATVLLYVDLDDPARSQVVGLAELRVQVVVGPPVGRGKAVNDLIDRHDFDNYLVVSDDVTYVRSGWDKEVLRAMDSFGDDIGCVHLMSENGESYVNWACVSRRWIKALGYLNYPGCHMYAQDTIIQALAEALGRVVQITPQVIQHDALAADDREEGPKGQPSHELLRNDAEAFLWYMAKYFGSDLAKLKAAMFHPSIA